jgi:hypothetical protein
MKMNKQLYLSLFGGLVVLLAMPLSAAAIHNGSATLPDMDPANFVSEVNNKFFPLRPGTTFFYEGTTDGVPTSDEMQVTRETKQILGVTTIVVHHRSFEAGELVEVTFDW